ncbi:hypothetical protein TWF173_002798 [Orbilia oligospora]|nr:hypothetical protein TWF173_002798 [Orbilia oligospora]
MFLKALLAPAALLGLASAAAFPPSSGLDLSTHSLNKRSGAGMWHWFPPADPNIQKHIAANPWKYVGCYSGQVPLTYHVADFCSCHNKGTSWEHNMEKCFASCKAAGFRYAGLKGLNGAKKCWCGSTDTIALLDYKLGSENSCNAPCSDGEGSLTRKYDINKCGGVESYSIWRDPCYKREFDVNEAPLGYESAGCWSGHGGWLLAHFEKSVSGDNLSIDSCIEACSANGYPYAGMRAGWECFCGGRLAPHFVDVHQKNPNHNTMCTKVCTSTWKVYATTPKEEWQYCGGDVYYSLYFNRKLAASSAEVCKDEDDETVTKVVQTITVTKGGPPPTEATESFDSDSTTRTTITVTGKTVQTITVTKDGPPPTEATQSFDSDSTTRTTITVPGKTVQTITVTKGGPPPKEATQSFDSDKTTRTTITVPGDAEPTPDPEDDKEDDDTEDDDTEDNDDDNGGPTVTQTIIVTKGRPLPKEATESYNTKETTRTTVTTTAGKGAKTYKVTQTIFTTIGRPPPREATERYNTRDTTRTTVTTTAAAKTYKVTQTIFTTEGRPPPKEATERYNTRDTTRTTVTTTAEPEPTEGPEEPEDDDDKEDGENPDDNNGNPGGKGGDDDDKKDDDKKDDDENPDDNNGNPGGKGGEEPGDKGPDLDDSLCSKPMVPRDVVKNTKWKNIKFPVGDVKAPAVSCHNRKSKYDAGYHFKLFVGPGTAWPDAVCRKEYTRKPTEIQAACSNACIEQKKSCTSSSKVRKIADYKALCEAQLVACQAINSLKVLPKYIELINKDYCKKPSPPFPKPPRAGGKPADDDEEEEIQYS